MTETAQEKAAREHRERHKHNDSTRGFEARPDNLAGCLTALLLGAASAPEFEGRQELRELLLHTKALFDLHRRELQDTFNRM